MGAFHHMARFSVYLASKESGYPMPLRLSGRRRVHFTHVQRNPEAPPQKAAYFRHGNVLSGYSLTF